MGTRGRKSAASLSIISVSGRPRLKPPQELRPEVASLFKSLVAASDSRHFTKSDVPLLVAYCESIVLADRAATSLSLGLVCPETEKTNPHLVIFEKATRAMVALALRLRLCPQSRQDGKTASRRAKRGPDVKPWEER